MSTSSDFFTLRFWLVFTREPSSEDPWIVHCLDVDVVTQGRSLRHACGMVAEAVQLMLTENALPQRPAPPEYWDRLWTLLRTHRRIDDLGEVLEHEPADLNSFATQMEIHLQRRQHVGHPGWTLPAPAFASDAASAA